MRRLRRDEVSAKLNQIKQKLRFASAGDDKIILNQIRELVEVVSSLADEVRTLSDKVESQSPHERRRH